MYSRRGAAIISADASLLSRFLRGASVYTLGTFLQRFNTLLLVPVYLARLEPRDFGILALTDFVSGLFVSALGLCLDRAVTRFFYEWKEEEVPERLGSLWAAAILSGFGATAFLSWIGPAAWARFAGTIPFDPYVRLALWIACLRNVGLIPLMVLRVREQAGRFVLFSVLNSLTACALVIGLVVFLRGGALGVLIGLLANEAAWSLVWLGYMRGRAVLRLSPRGLKSTLAYSLPMVPSDVLYNIGLGFDRVLLARLLPLEGLGLYYLANRIGRVLQELNQAAKNAWIPAAVRLGVQRRDTAPALLTDMGETYVCAFAWIALALALLSGEAVALLGGGRYLPAMPMVPGFVAAYLGYVFYFLHLPGLQISGKTGYISAATGAYALVNVILNCLLVPRLGVPGAILSLFLSIQAMSWSAYLASSRSFPCRYPLLRWHLLIAAAAAAFLLGSRLEGPWSLPWKAAVLVLYGVLLVNFRRRSALRAPVEEGATHVVRPVQPSGA